MFQLFGGEQMKQAKVLSSEELKRVMAICVTMQNGKRNRLMLMLSHYAGMRVGEIASLKWADVLDKDLNGHLLRRRRDAARRAGREQPLFL